MGIVKNPKYDYPADDQLEISVFGGGNCYGESILIHGTDEFWISVASFLNPFSDKPVHLEYLENISLTWHDDHIKGISEIWKRVRNAKRFALHYFYNQMNFSL